MSLNELPPLVFRPVIKQIRWGGRKLGSMLGKAIGDDSDYAESWEIADHADGMSLVADGPLAGMTLAELVKTAPVSLFGKYASLTQFPLLIKFLDANDWLSLQVHPDAGAYAGLALGVQVLLASLLMPLALRLF
ncbi:MAG: hypothetical protein J0M20_15025 [Burkholderiales bacterium]|nr:hypothetical protein [Burkholderiales bacterium]